MQIIGEAYRLHWTGVLTPAAYAGSDGTVLKETGYFETKDLSTLSGTWQGIGDLAGTHVDYTLTISPGAAPDCPSEQPPQCAEIAGGCLPAEPPVVERPVVYEISSVVN